MNILRRLQRTVTESSHRVDEDHARFVVQGIIFDREGRILGTYAPAFFDDEAHARQFEKRLWRDTSWTYVWFSELETWRRKVNDLAREGQLQGMDVNDL